MQVEIWSDVACPWCYVGKRRFESALARFAHRDQVDVVWRSFELDPSAPPRHEGASDERLARKYGRSLAEAQAMHAQMTATGAQEGLTFRFDLVRGGNTFDAHRLIHLAAARGLQDEVKEALLHAYFEDGLEIGDHDSLVATVAAAGLDADEARAVLTSDAYADAVRADERRGAQFGIRGVPFFAIDEKYGVSGAQPADVLLGALEQAWAESHPLIPLGVQSGEAGLCEDGSCELPGAAATSAARGSQEYAPRG